MKDNVFVFALVCSSLLAVCCGCPQKPPIPPPDPPAKLLNGTQVLVKVSKMMGTIIQRKEANADLGDLYIVRYTNIDGRLDVVNLREWELQPLNIEVKAEVDDSVFLNH